MPSANCDSFIYPFPMWIHFISFSCLIVMAGTFSNILNKRDNIGYLGLAPDLTRNAFSFSPLSMLLAVSLSYMTFIMLGWVSFMPTFWRVFFFFFNNKWVLNFVKSIY